MTAEKLFNYHGWTTRTPHSMFYHKIITIIEIIIIILIIIIVIVIMIMIMIMIIIINDFIFSNNPVFSLLAEVSHD